MKVDKELRVSLTNLYGRLNKLDNRLHGLGGAWRFLLIAVIALPLAIFSDSHPVIVAVIWILWLWSVFRYKLDLSEIDKTHQEIINLEQKLENHSNLLYCECSKLEGHFFCPNEEKLFGLTHGILFDEHSVEDYKSWHMRYKPEKTSSIWTYYSLVFIVFVMNISFTYLVYL